MKKKNNEITLSADRQKLEEIANHVFETDEEAAYFFKSLSITAILGYEMSNLTKEDTTILTDTLAALMYVQI